MLTPEDIEFINSVPRSICLGYKAIPVDNCKAFKDAYNKLNPTYSKYLSIQNIFFLTILVLFVREFLDYLD